MVHFRLNLRVYFYDRAVLEMHHAASAFKFTVNDEKANIFKNMPRLLFIIFKQFEFLTFCFVLKCFRLTKVFSHLRTNAV